jgi:hypothetical protein
LPKIEDISRVSSGGHSFQVVEEIDATPRHFVITTSAHSTMKFSAIILVAAVMVSLADAFLPAALPRRRAAMARLRMMGQVDVTIEKPLGITLEENEADAAKGVFCKLLANPGAAYVSVRTTDCGL